MGTDRVRRLSCLLWPALALGLILIAASPYLWFIKKTHAPYKGYEGNEIRVLINRGSTVSTIAAQLEQEGVIESSRLFRLYAHLNGRTLDLKAGE